MHHIFQRLGIPPDEVMKKPRGVRAFMFASMLVQLEAEKKLYEKSARQKVNVVAFSRG